MMTFSLRPTSLSTAPATAASASFRGVFWNEMAERNDARVSERMRRVVQHTLGAEALIDVRPTMGAEDFSAYQQRAPGTFFFVGARNEERGIVQPHHHERFDIDERALDLGTRLFVAAARDFLSGSERA